MAPSTTDHEDDDDDHVVVKITSLLVLGVGLVSLFLGFDFFWVVFVVGFAVVLPLVKVLTNEFLVEESETATATGRSPSRSERSTSGSEETTSRGGPLPGETRDALDTLRDRYARGELSEEAFERKVEHLLETETPESAREHVGRERDGASDHEDDVERTG